MVTATHSLGGPVPPPSTTLDARAVRNDAAIGIGEILQQSSGVTVVEGNGPRDAGVSIRGSNVRVNSGVRNIVVLEDGFPVTQPNGIARLDLADPHAYGAIDIVKGPSSARYGNFALEGAIDFHLRRGHDIDGVEGEVDGGSFGSLNASVIEGAAGDTVDHAVFASIVRGDGTTGHTGYVTGTVNALTTIALGPRDRLTGKFILNAGGFDLSTRLSLAQYQANPYQQGCGRAASAAAGCGTLTLFANGIGGARVVQTAAEADMGSRDRRLLGGLRFEHDLSAATLWRIQGVLDRRTVDQPTGALVSQGALTSLAIETAIEARGTIAGLAATSTAGVAYGYLDNRFCVFARAAQGLGALNQTVLGSVQNWRAHAAESVELAPAWSVVVAASVERSLLDVVQTGYSYPPAGAPVSRAIPAHPRFWNAAPEAALFWRLAPATTLHARASAGYGVPQLGQLFVTAAGVPGDNIALKAQSNRGVEVGVVHDAGPTLSAEATVFYEWFHDEQVTTSAGANLLSFTTNAPRSRHRGVEIGARWRPTAVPGAYAWANYSFDDQRYAVFTEQVTGGTVSRGFDRSGARIPGVIPHAANLRLGYERERGSAAGLGGFAQLELRSSYAIDNGGHLAIPGYAIVQLGVHYTPPRRGRTAPTIFLTIRNLFDHVYVGSAAIVADTLDPATGQENGASVLRGATGSIYAGQPRTVTAGIRARF